MHTMLTLIGKELGQQATWLALWLAAAHVKLFFALLGVAMIWASGQQVPGAEEISGPEGALLAVAFTMPRSDSSILTFVGVGFFFFWGGFRVFQQEAQQGAVAWLRTMPVPDSRAAFAKLLVAGLYTWLVLAPAIGVFLAMPGGWAASQRGYPGFATWIAGQYLVVWAVFFSFVVLGALVGTLAATGRWAGIGSSKRAHLKHLAAYGAAWAVALVSLAVVFFALQAVGGFESVRWMFFYGGGGQFAKSLPVLSAHVAVIVICGGWLVRAWARRPLFS